MANSYSVWGTFFDASKHYLSPTTKIPADKIVSMQGLTNTVTSWPRDKDMPQQPHFISVHGKPYAVNKTSNRIYLTTAEDYFKNGDATQIDDGPIGSVPFPNWIANSTQNPPVNNDHIPTFYDITGNKIGGVAYITGITPLRMYFPNENDTKVPDYVTHNLVVATDINSIGKRESQLDTFKQKIRSGVLFNDTNQFHYEITKCVEFLDSKGFAPNESPVLGIGIERGNFIAAYYPEQRYLVANFDFHDTARNLMQHYGLTEREAVEAAERYIIFHELVHAYGVKGGRRGEKLQGELLAEFYSELADEFRGGRFEKIYKSLAEDNIHYAKQYSLGNWLLREATKSPEFEGIDLVVHKFWHEGIALGYSGKKLDKYIKSRLKDTYKDLIDDEESNDYTNRKKNSRKSRLENIVENEGAAERAITNYKGRTDGKVVYLSEIAKAKSTTKSNKVSNEKVDGEKTYEEKVVNITEYRRSRDAKAEKSEQKETLQEEAQETETPQGEAAEAA